MPARRFGLWLRRSGAAERWVVIATFALVVGMYLKNDDMGGDFKSPRGDGVYRPVLARGDGHMLYLIARSTALDLDWNFENDLKFGDPWRQATNPKTHRKIIPQPVGPALVWTPLIWIAHAGSKVANLFGANIPSHGYTPWHQRFVFLSSAVGACLAIWLAMRVAKKLAMGKWAITYAGVAVLLASPLTYYATHMPSYNHALDALACSGFLAYWVLTLGRTDWKRFVWLGVLLGLAMLIRMQELGLGVVVAFEVVVDVVKRRRVRMLVGGAVVLAIALVMFVPQLAFWKVIYGGWFAAPQGGAYTRPTHPMIFELLWSSRNGWFSSHPVCYAGVLGLFFVPKQARFATAGLLLALVVQLYLCSTIFDYWGQASFGSRRLCSMTLPVVVGLAALIWRCGRLAAKWPKPVTHALAVLVLAPFIAWNLDRVIHLNAGKAAPEGMQPCCDRAPPWIRGALTNAFNTVGNPFEFPANFIFALRHGVGIQRWDAAVGNYPVMPNFDQLSQNQLAGVSGRWRVGFPDNEQYLIGAWSAAKQTDRWYRLTLDRQVRVLVPNILPNDQHVSVWLAPAGARHVKLSWNDQPFFDGDLRAGWNEIGMTIYGPGVGEHELTISSELGTCPGMPRACGVALHSIDLRVIK